jgi:hypothetical protein
MPRDGAITLTDLQASFLRLVCEPCGRPGRYAVRPSLRNGATQNGNGAALFRTRVVKLLGTFGGAPTFSNAAQRCLEAAT